MTTSAKDNITRRLRINVAIIILLAVCLCITTFALVSSLWVRDNLFQTGKVDIEIWGQYYEATKNTDNPEISFGLSELYMLLADIYLKTNKKELACNYYLKAKRIKNNIIKDKDKLDNFINKYENLYL